MEWFVGFPLKDQALAGAPALALCPFPRVSASPPNPAWRRKQPSFWPPIPPTLHQTLPRDAPETPRRPSDPRSEGRWGVSGGATEVGAGGWGTPFLPFHRKQLGTTLSGITASQYLTYTESPRMVLV